MPIFTVECARPDSGQLYHRKFTAATPTEALKRAAETGHLAGRVVDAPVPTFDVLAQPNRDREADAAEHRRRMYTEFAFKDSVQKRTALSSSSLVRVVSLLLLLNLFAFPFAYHLTIPQTGQAITLTPETWGTGFALAMAAILAWVMFLGLLKLFLLAIGRR